MNYIKYIFLVAPVFLIGCSSQGGSGSTASESGSGDGDEAPSETLTAASRTVPDFDSMTLAVTQANTTGLDIVGETVTVTVRVADNLNDQTVLDGTIVNFATEGGAIEENCTLASGACSVVWTSQSPIPADGRSTVIAYMNGSESFADLNASGFYDENDLFNDAAVDARGDQLRPDLSEPFLNDNKTSFIDPNRPAFFGTNINFDSTRDPNEVFFDSPGLTSNSFDGPDGLFSGASCAHPTDCSPTPEIFIWRDTEIIMGGNDPRVTIYTSDPRTNAAAAELAGNVNVVGNGVQTLFIAYHDRNGNPLASGTTVSISAEDVAISGLVSFDIGSIRFPTVSIIDIIGDDTSSTGRVEIRVTTPGSALISGTEDVFVIRTND